MQAKKYNFVTIWKLKAPIQTVWDVIFDSEQWQTWWKAVHENKIIEHKNPTGLHNVIRTDWNTALPYKLRVMSEVTNIKQYEFIELKAEGELEGYGKWTFSQEGEICIVRYDWRVITNKKWMNWFHFLLNPIFKWNHNQVMRWGGEGLAKKLNSNFLEIIHQ